MAKVHHQRNKTAKPAAASATPALVVEHLNKLQSLLDQFTQSLSSACTIAQQIQTSTRQSDHIEAVLSDLALDEDSTDQRTSAACVMTKYGERIPLASNKECRQEVVHSLQLRLKSQIENTQTLEAQYYSVLEDFSPLLVSAQLHNLIISDDAISLEPKLFAAAADKLIAEITSRFETIRSEITSDPVSWKDQQLHEAATSSLPGYPELLALARSSDPKIQQEGIDALITKYPATEIRAALRSLKSAKSGLNFDQLRSLVLAGLESYTHVELKVADFCCARSSASVVSKLGLAYARERIALIESYAIPDAVLKAVLPLRGECMTETTDSLRDYLEHLKCYTAESTLLPTRRIDDPCSYPQRFLCSHEINLRAAERDAVATRLFDPDLVKWATTINNCERQLAQNLRRIPTLAPYAQIAAQLTCRVFFRYGDYSPYYSIGHVFNDALARGILTDSERPLFDATLAALEKLEIIEYRHDSREFLKLIPGSPTGGRTIIDAFKKLRELSSRCCFMSYTGTIRLDNLDERSPVPIRVTTALGACETLRRLKRFLDRSETLCADRDLLERTCVSLNTNAAADSQLRQDLQIALHRTHTQQMRFSIPKTNELAGQLILAAKYEVRSLLASLPALSLFLEKIPGDHSRLEELLASGASYLEAPQHDIDSLAPGIDDNGWIERWQRLPWRSIYSAAISVAEAFERSSENIFIPLIEQLEQFIQQQGIGFDEI